MSHKDKQNSLDLQKRTSVPVTNDLSYYFIDISMVTEVVFVGDNY